MTRTTKELLNLLLADLIRSTNNSDFSIGWAYGQPRLENLSGSRDISPRLSKCELEQYLRAMIKGADLKK